MSQFSMSRRALMAGSALALALPEATGAAAPLTSASRAARVLERRREAALAESAGEPANESNGDEESYADRRASFSKTMPHNELGEVEPDAYRAWLAIVAAGDSAAFAQAPRDPAAVERLNNPQAAYAIDLIGPDGAVLALAPPPRLASARMAAEMAELYWLALMRDVAFRDYGGHPLAAAASRELRTLGLGEVSPDTLFRGDTRGERSGPFVSQFLWLDIPYGITRIEQRFRVPSRDQAFLTGVPEWLACQRGAKMSRTLGFDSEPRFIASYRELVEYVHRDFSFQPFMDAAFIILAMGGDRGDGVWSPTNPYRGSQSQFGDITFGAKNVLTLLAEASLLAQKVSYYHKWQVHRRARPESVGGRIEMDRSGRKSYDLHAGILESEGLARVKSGFGCWLLPQAYPEGCPTHPSYPAAHAVNAGACATVLKAFFDGSFVVPRPVEASADGARLEPWRGTALTLRGEIDKLAANIAFARDAAGVHFRSDTASGLALGEDVAIGLLADVSRTYSETFDGFVLSRFDGRKIHIAEGVARPA